MLDPRLKLRYYEDNKWKQSFIDYAKETVLDIYNINYALTAADEYLNDEFLDHIFGKQKKIEQNEVELYLKADIATQKQDILLWWKVYIIFKTIFINCMIYLDLLV